MSRILAAVALALLTLATACSSDVGRASAPPVTALPVTATEDSVPTVSSNPFLPESENVGDCISALERPDCGSKAKGGLHQALVFVALLLGLSIIGWRVVVAVRRNDRARHR